MKVTMAAIDKVEFAGYTLDARSLYCPEPVMMLHNMIRDISPGEKIRVLATDPSTKRDIPKFCQFLGHELLHNSEETDGGGEGDYIYVFVIAKANKTTEA